MNASWFAAALGVFACDASDTYPPDGESTIAESWISARDGGAIELGEHFSLFIPPGSLAADTLIQVEKVDAPDAAAMDGFIPMGGGYRLAPDGLGFRLDAPAILRMRYASDDIAASGVHPRTLQMYRFDERLGQHVNVATNVDTEQQLITAQLEQLALYLPMGQALVPGNDAPFVSLQNPVPYPVRAEAPIYVRTTASDFDIGGALASVEFCHRLLQPSPGTYQCAEMSPETRENVVSTYALLLDASTLTAADLAAGNDLEYYVQATDNLGAVTTSASVSLDVTTIYTPGSLFLQPGDVDMTAGSTRIFTAYGMDDLGATFPLVPESESVSPAIGEFVRKEANGLTFQADTVGFASLTASVGADQATTTIDVFNGHMSRLQILDSMGLPLDGTFAVGEATEYQFNAVGYDDWGNTIPVLPAWSSSPEVGQPITQDGLLDTTDGAGFGTVSASLGALDITQWLRIIPLRWVLQGESLTDNYIGVSIAADAATTYVSWAWVESLDDCPISVKRWDGSAWTDLGGAVNPGGCALVPRIASCDGAPYVAWTDYQSLENYSGARENPQTRVATWNGGAWTMVGEPLQIQPESGGNHRTPSLSCAGATPYVAWREHGQVFVKRWNGSAWVQDGGLVNDTTSPAPVSASIIIADTTPYVTYSQSDGVAVQTHVKRWDGSAWVPVGGNLNADPTVDGYGTIFACGDTPWAVVGNHDGNSYTALYAMYWDGTAWVQAPGALPFDPTMSLYWSAVCANGKPYIALAQQTANAPYNSVVHVHHWNGSAWVQTGGEDININEVGFDYNPQLAPSPSGRVSIVWAEESSANVQRRLFVKSLEPCDSGCGEEMVCGDGVLDPIELCDDGADNSYNGDCLADLCTPAVCGDGYVDTMGPDVEECDGDGAGTGGESSTCDWDCTLAVCGDGMRNESAGEVCDDGDTIDSGNGCSATCTQNNVCGDGIHQWYFEECDDGNTTSGDGCSATCTSECGDGIVNPPGEECDDAGESSTCDWDCTLVVCGDGIRNTSAGEACDDGDSIDSGNGCSATCMQNNVCGDGVLQWYFEDCDDGNTTSGDGCSATCTSECGDGVVNPPGEECDDAGESSTCDWDCTLAVCGDGMQNESAGEACDDGNTADDGNGCSATCTQNNVCGDGVIQWYFEDCDDGNATSGDGCSATCRSECGNGVVNPPGEECDDAGQSSTCDWDCTLAVCGDGMLNESAGEACDDGNTTDDGNGCSATCTQNDVCGDGIHQWYFEECDDGNTTSGDGCSATCTIECGNGVVDPPLEECDDAGQSSTCDWDCTLAVCGDGMQNESAGEACDDGDTTDDGNGCSATCTQNNVCGDGVLQWYFEGCDDGNTTDGDGCSATCAIE